MPLHLSPWPKSILLHNRTWKSFVVDTVSSRLHKHRSLANQPRHPRLAATARSHRPPRIPALASPPHHHADHERERERDSMLLLRCRRSRLPIPRIFTSSWRCCSTLRLLPAGQLLGGAASPSGPRRDPFALFASFCWKRQVLRVLYLYRRWLIEWNRSSI
jgi:hypothetical protein